MTKHYLPCSKCKTSSKLLSKISNWNEHEHYIQCPKCNKKFSSTERLQTEQKNALSILHDNMCQECLKG